MHNTPAVSDVSTLIRAAAAEAARYQLSLDRTSMAREYKRSPQDIVTEHDVASEDIIRRVLTEGAPYASIVGEEGGVSSGATDVTFYVDPIDGTSNFAAGLPLFAVSIAAAVGDDLVASVMNAPALGYEFYGTDEGAFLNGTKLGPHEPHERKDALVLTSFPGWRDSREFPSFAAEASLTLKRDFSAVRSLGSAAIELAFVAAGGPTPPCCPRSPRGT